MKSKRIPLTNIFIGLLIGASLIVTPVLAQVLTEFQAGETISSSQINGNFSNLQDQITNICTLPGQVALAARVDVSGLGASFNEPFFACGDISNVNVGETGTGEYILNLDGLNPDTQAVVHVTPVPVSQFANYCNVRPESTRVLIDCYDDSGAAEDSPFFITLIRR